MQATAFQPGHRLGDLTLDTLLQSRLGAWTWRARTSDGNPVVVKILEDSERGIVRALQRSFRRAHGLAVRGVTAPLQLSCDRAPTYLVRPWVDGVPLLELIREFPADERVSRALQLGAMLCARLADIHREGLTHGNLGSSNVWVTREDEVWITDLGSAIRRVKTGVDVAPGHLPPRAPEELAGWAPRAATDVLAVGALLYAALIPTPDGETDHTLPWGSAAREAPPGLALRVPEVPRRLCRLLADTQALDPSDRPTAAELARRLADPQLSTEPAPLPPCPARVGDTETFQEARLHLSAPGTRILLLHGPAGSGRRRLADGLCRAQLRAGSVPLRIRARRDELGSVIIGALRRTVGPDQHAARRQRLLRELEAPLSALWPELAASPHPRSGQYDVNEVLDAALTVIERAIIDRPAVWVVEQLEDADPLSLRWLRRLADASNAGFKVIGILDDRWQPAELVRLRERLHDKPAVLSLGRRDVSARSAVLIHNLLTRALPEDGPPEPTLEGASLSPARITEMAHATVARWRGESELKPDVAATVFALADDLPQAALEALGLDVQEVLERGVAVPSRPGWLRAAHEGVVELGRRGLQRRDKLAERLSAVLADLDCEPELRARVGLCMADADRTLAARAAIAAWTQHRADDARRWLHVAERLPRASGDAAYQALRPTLSRVRVEVAHSRPNAMPRPDLLQQAERRARTPSEHADLHAARGLVLLCGGHADEAVRTWREGAAAERASPAVRLRCAAYQFDHTLDAGQIVLAGHAAQTLRRICHETQASPTMQRVSELRAVRYALAQGEPSGVLQRIKEWTISHPGFDPEMEMVRAEAALQSGRPALAQESLNAVLDADPLQAEAIVLRGLLALDAGDTRAAIRAQRQLQQLEASGPWLLPFRLRLTVAQGETAQLQPLLGVTAPTRRPDHRAAWMAASLDVLRMVREPAIRLARVEEAQRHAASSPFPDLHIALAWHLLDDGNNAAAAARARTAEDLAHHLSDPGRTLRARLLHSAATGVSPGAWTYLLERARQVGWRPLLADALELSVHVARRHQVHAEVQAAIRELSELAVSGPDHGLAARATRLARS